MTPVQLLRLLSEHLEKQHFRYAVCGGIAASIYRTTFRLTNDLDIAVGALHGDQQMSEQELITDFLGQLGIKHALGWIPNIAHGTESNVFTVIGELGGNLPTVDFLLPRTPWVDGAVVRAQSNAIDFGFGFVPTVTPEDLIVSKVFALAHEPKRITDIDDIRSILKSETPVDKLIIGERLQRMGLSWDPAEFDIG